MIDNLTTHLQRLLTNHTPALIGVFGLGPDTAAQLLITAGDNPDQLRSGASFAALTTSCPVPASSGKTTRLRLNRAGDRHANSPHHVVIVRMRHDETTLTYVQRRTAEGKTKKEIIRCPKRYLLRQLYPVIYQTLRGDKPAATA